MLIVDRQKAKKVVWKEQACRKLWFKGFNLCNIQKSSGEVPTGFDEKKKKKQQPTTPFCHIFENQVEE